MANPFLVLGGIAISVVTAAFGVLAVPGWITSAQDAAALSDASQLRIAESAASSAVGTYLPSIEALNASASGVKVNLSGGVTLAGISATTDSWCAVVRSSSGNFFGAGDEGIVKDGKAGVAAAADAAGCSAAERGAVLAWAASHGIEVGTTPAANYGATAEVPRFYNATYSGGKLYGFAESDGSIFSLDPSGTATDPGFSCTAAPSATELAVDAAGNAYVEAYSADWRLGIYRLAPGGGCTQVLDFGDGIGDMKSKVANSPDGTVWLMVDRSDIATLAFYKFDAAGNPTLMYSKTGPAYTATQDWNWQLSTQFLSVNDAGDVLWSKRGAENSHMVWDENGNQALRFVTDQQGYPSALSNDRTVLGWTSVTNELGEQVDYISKFETASGAVTHLTQLQGKLNADFIDSGVSAGAYFLPVVHGVDSDGAVIASYSGDRYADPLTVVFTVQPDGTVAGLPNG